MRQPCLGNGVPIRIEATKIRLAATNLGTVIEVARASRYSVRRLDRNAAMSPVEAAAERSYVNYGHHRQLRMPLTRLSFG